MYNGTIVQKKVIAHFLRSSISLLFLFISSFFVFATPTFAQENPAFKTTLHSIYEVDKLGVTRVTHDFTITNLTPTLFLKQYGMTTSYPELQTVAVSYKGSIIPSNVVSTSNGTSIGITFNDELVGEGKTREFQITYVNHDLATIGGSVLEIYIPKFAENTEITSHKITLRTPKKFGGAVRVLPTPSNESSNEEIITTTFENIKDSSVTALFGSYQNFNMTLRYHLQNDGNAPGIAQIALPPDTPYQKMYYHSIEPYSNDVKIDRDGNWIATYTIPPHTTTVVQVGANARISLLPEVFTGIEPPSEKLTNPQEFWESTDPVIEDLATIYNTPQQIYTYVTTTLSYNHDVYSQGTRRLGAVAAVQNPNSAVCQEFTDVFIAIARAANIPARRVVGYAYTQNNTIRPLSFEGDILHSWPEYYDAEKSQWIPVDPTWGNTTGGIDYFNVFDLNHIVFSINGHSSTDPYPAGSYKTINDETKDVEVTFSNNFPDQQGNFSILLEPIKLFGIAIPGNFTFKITNKTGQAWYDIQVNTSSVANELHQQTTSLEYILPYQTRELAIRFSANTWQLLKEYPVTISVSDSKNNVTYTNAHANVTVFPSILTGSISRSTLIAMGISTVIIALGTGSLLVSRQKRNRALRRQSKKSEKSSEIIHADQSTES